MIAILDRLMAPARSARIAMVALALGVAPACGVSGLSFVHDDRVDIVRPDDRSEVRLPVTVRWTVDDFAVGPGEGSFGIFVDRNPQPSGKTLAWLFRGDSGCKGTGARVCATPEYLGQRSVYRTTRTAFTVEQVNKLTGSQAGRELHEVTVVLLDGSGRRVGEGAWSVQFEVQDDN
jgi:hypothetical protein